MTYLVMRALTGASNRTPQELSKIAQQELFPQLTKSGGLLRYSTLLFNDQRIGSIAVYQDKAAAERGISITSGWMKDTGALADYKLDESYQGTVAFALQGDADQSQTGGCGIGRIYRTSASGNDIKAALEPLADKIKAMPGFIRMNAVAIEGGIGVFSAFTSAESASRLTEFARETRLEKNSALSKVLPDDPRTLQVTILSTNTL